MLNVAVLQGRLVADPELRHTQSDIAVCSFRIAVDRNFGGSERQADFIDVVAWRQTAEFVCKYFTKGQMIALDGRIQTRNYEDKNGNKRTAVEVVADNVNFCGPKSGDSPGGRERPPARVKSPAPAAAAWGQPVGQPAPAQPDGDPQQYFDMDDDLPF